MEDRDAMTFKFDPGIRRLIERCSDLEHRTMTDYLEVLVIKDAKSKGISIPRNTALPKSNNAGKK